MSVPPAAIPTEVMQPASGIDLLAEDGSEAPVEDTVDVEMSYENVESKTVGMTFDNEGPIIPEVEAPPVVEANEEDHE
jgi:hypothetical protein